MRTHVVGDWDDVANVIDDLAGMLDSYRWEDVDVCVRQLIARTRESSEEFPNDEARRILSHLRRKRRFVHMELLADALVRDGVRDPEVRRQYAQALIERESYGAAESLLNDLLREQDLPPREKVEAVGLLGRAYKQQYVDAAQPNRRIGPRQQKNLRTAIERYGAVYKEDPTRVWHGINVAACLARCERDGVETDGLPFRDYRVVATSVLEHLATIEERDGSLAYFDRATAVEANIALGRCDNALKHLRRYLTDDKRVDAFEASSLLRQLRQVWQLSSDTDCERHLMAMLSAVAAKREGGDVELQANEIRRTLEAKYGDDGYLPLGWWHTGLSRCLAIARIDTIHGRHVGSAFLVDPQDFAPGEQGPLLLTNHHVISRDGHSHSIAPEAAVAHFEITNPGRDSGSLRLKVLSIVASNEAVDATLVRIAPLPPGALATPCPLTPAPAAWSSRPRHRIYVIGYPSAEGLSFSIHDSQWVEAPSPYLHYRTPTKGGSSGSPLFDEDYWTLVGMHRGSLPERQLNQGIQIAAIRDALRTDRHT